MNKRECTQTQCSFHKSHGEMAMLCPICDDCGCEGNVIDEDCTNCWNCLRDADYLRKGTPTFGQEIKTEVKAWK